MNMLKKNEGRTLPLVPICILVSALALFSIMRTCRSSDPTHEYRNHLVSAMSIAAEETATFLTNKNTVVILTAAPNQVAVLDEMVNVFQASLEAQGLQVLAVESLAPEDDAGPRALPGFFPGDELVSLVDAYPAVDAVVSLVGAPSFNGPYPALSPTVVAAYGGSRAIGNELDHLIQRGVVSMAIVPVTSESKAEPKEKRTRAWFDQHFKIITADTLMDLEN